MLVSALPKRSEVPAVRAPAKSIQVWERESPGKKKEVVVGGRADPEWPFFCPAAYIRPGGRMSEVTWSFFSPAFPHKHTHILSHARSRSSSSPPPLFSKCLERPRQDTVAASSCSLSPPTPLEKKNSSSPCIRTVPSNICARFYFSPHSPRCFLFLLYLGVSVGVFRHPTVPGGQSPTESVSLQVKTFFCLVFIVSYRLSPSRNTLF